MRWVQREWVNPDGRRMCAIVTEAMAALSDEELRLGFALMHGVPYTGTQDSSVASEPPGCAEAARRAAGDGQADG
ncbi:hypothetical protein [Streptomyces sp. CG 926]|uniref:hypothetical protein n=1 Tax=Streptomyces sp. CG 926 TaxID=1882405 RepID=UPI000D6C08C8|nr:hypothetical protein [Streptomyces sp. CG 926]